VRTKEEKQAEKNATKTAWQEAIYQKALDDFHEQYAGHDFDTVLDPDQQSHWLKAYTDAAKGKTKPEELQALMPVENKKFNAVKQHMVTIENPEVPEPLDNAAREVAGIWATKGMEAAEAAIKPIAFAHEVNADALTTLVLDIRSAPRPYHENAAALAGKLHEYGGVEQYTVPDPHKPNSFITLNTPSRNPDWYLNQTFKPITASGEVLHTTPSGGCSKVCAATGSGWFLGITSSPRASSSWCLATASNPRRIFS